jgi:hypothetical protein
VEKKFTSDEVPLAQLLNEAGLGNLQLPDFQRGWVWDDNHITSLLASISLSYPIGAVMTLQTGNPEVKFRPRPFQGVRLDSDIDPELLLLDGQQRMTSLYLALKSGRPVPTRDAKGKELSRRYFADIAACLNPAADREEAILSIPGDGLVKNFRGEVLLDVSTREKEIAAGIFPLAIALDQPEAMTWLVQFLEGGPGDDKQRRHQIWTEFQYVVNAFHEYQVPTIQLIKSTPKEAVCQVFEKVNTGGVSLTVFELLTATYAADDFNLRDDWRRRKEAFDAHPVLERVKETDFVQVVTLLATRARRLRHLEDNPGDEKAPAISCKRRDVLRLPLEDYAAWADAATEALVRVVPFLQTEHVFTARDIPYETQLVPLAAIFATLGGKAEGHGARGKLARWYWCGVFGEMYGGSVETRFALDLPDVVAWVADGEDEPRTIRDAQFQAERLLTLKTRNAAAYKGLYALQMKRGARDFRTGNAIDVHAYIGDAIDIHHVFPQSWCTANGIDIGYANSVVNKTPIDAHTNRSIGRSAPSRYLAKIETAEEIPPPELDAILQSHEIDSMALRADDFEACFDLRFERLLKLIETAMGKAVNRNAAADESPFADAGSEAENFREAIEAMIAAGESKVVEFKSTGRRNLHTGEKDEKIEWAVAKTLAGFMNSHGGTLLVGVADSGELIGIEEDFDLLGKQDPDGWELWLTEAVSSRLGKGAAAELDVRIARVDGKHVARVVAGPAAEPIFAKSPGTGEAAAFPVRLNNSTQELHGSEMVSYQKSRWPS